MSSKGELQSLLLGAKTLTNHMGFKTDNIIQRNPDQLLESTQRLATKASVDVSDPAKAQYLLACRGFNVEKQQRSITAISVKNDFEPVEALADTDLDGYLKHRREIIICTAIEEAKKNTIEQFEESSLQNMFRDWEDRRSQVLEMLGHLRRPEEALRLPTAHGVNSSSTARRELLRYAMIIRQLNLNRFPNTHSLFLEECTFTAEEVGLNVDADRFSLIPDLFVAGQTDSRSQVVQQSLRTCWTLLHNMCGMEGNGHDEKRYLEDHYKDSKELRVRLMGSACRFFEQQRKDYVRSMVSQNPRKAARGGKPGFRNDVTSYLNISYSSNQHIREQMQPWEAIYICLRCGEHEEAFQIASEQSQDEAFVECLTEYVREGGRVDERSAKNLQSNYNTSIEGNPWKEASYNIVGHCDPSWSNQEVLSTIEDYLWFQLTMARTTDERAVNLKRIQEEIRKWGPQYFNDPILYFQILVSLQCFEEAVHYLVGVSHNQLEAVHMAIALYYCGLLRQPSDDVRQERLAGKEKGSGLPFLSFGRLMMDYVSQFPAADATFALQYLLLIREEGTQAHALKTLILESREYDLLAGVEGHNGGRRAGLVEAYLGRPGAQRVLHEAAVEALERAHYSDAVRLHFVAGDFTDALQIINRQLSRVASKPPRADDRARTVEMANSYRDTLYRLHAKVDADRQYELDRLQSTLEQLLWISCFFDTFHEQEYHRAWQIISNLDILPLRRETSALQEEYSARFEDLHDEVKRVFADVVVATMRVLHRLFVGTVNNAEYRAYAKAIVTFCSRIPYRMPPDAQLEISRLKSEMA